MIALVLAVGLTGTVVAMDMHGVLVYISYHLVLPFLSRWRFLAFHGLPAIYLSTVSLEPLTAAAPQRSPAAPSHYGSRDPRVTNKGIKVRLINLSGINYQRKANTTNSHENRNSPVNILPLLVMATEATLTPE